MFAGAPGFSADDSAAIWLGRVPQQGCRLDVARGPWCVVVSILVSSDIALLCVVEARLH